MRKVYRLYVAFYCEGQVPSSTISYYIFIRNSPNDLHPLPPKRVKGMESLKRIDST